MIISSMTILTILAMWFTIALLSTVFVVVQQKIKHKRKDLTVGRILDIIFFQYRIDSESIYYKVDLFTLNPKYINNIIKNKINNKLLRIIIFFTFTLFIIIPSFLFQYLIIVIYWFLEISIIRLFKSL